MDLAEVLVGMDGKSPGEEHSPGNLMADKEPEWHPPMAVPFRLPDSSLVRCATVGTAERRYLRLS